MNVLKELVDISDQVNQRLEEERQALLDLPRPSPMTRAQQEATWSPDCVPSIPAYRTCLLCRRKSIISPIENDEVRVYNQQVTKDFRYRTRAWNEYNAKLKSDRQDVPFPSIPADPTGNKVLKRRSVVLKHKSQLLMYICMCSRSMCFQRNPLIWDPPVHSSVRMH